MTAITIDKDKAIELLEKQVEKKGADYVYPYAACEYFAEEDMELRDRSFLHKIPVQEGQPLCIVGHVYSDLGLTVNDLYMTSENYDSERDEWEKVKEQNQSGTVGDVLPNAEKVILTEEAQQVFQAAQDTQDNGYTWGAALVAAKGSVA